MLIQHKQEILENKIFKQSLLTDFYKIIELLVSNLFILKFYFNILFIESSIVDLYFQIIIF